MQPIRDRRKLVPDSYLFFILFAAAAVVVVATVLLYKERERKTAIATALISHSKVNVHTGTRVVKSLKLE